MKHKNTKAQKHENICKNQECFWVLRQSRPFLCLSDQQGVAALLTVIIIAAATITMAFTASLLGLGELELGYISQKSSETLSVADSCAEDTLRRLRLDLNYSGGMLNVGDGSCIINITPDGDNRTIIVESVIEKYYKKIQVEATLSGSNTAINSWQELDN